MDFVGPAIGVAVGIGLTAAMPAALYALGFTKAGITAGTMAARLMSLAAMANGGSVAAGSLVAIAQSLGAAGVPTAVTVALSAIGAVIGAMIPRIRALL
ncbi:PREDICTED: interferon alpha-inducible protein 27-like protein 2A [Pygoscelis adeliae]|uniref:interferon alpha-inducible protein 27-like protein 2A n=1 Tax=Pygoscelis adeliae TaxID=9238 RepID=UPI0004F4F71D|nr:PREDICTED: interferon alpha-inducible protein 27-like protein 2A [Pygoscelis adeliae]